MQKNYNSIQRNRVALEQEGENRHSSHRSQKMEIENESHYQYPQAQKTISKKDLALAKRLTYFMDAAYKRVIQATNDCLNNIHSGNGELDHDILKLNLLIDNTYIQFRSVHEKFPKNLESNFKETLSRMNQHTQHFYNAVPPEGKQAISNPFTRLDTVLKLKPFKMMEVQKVEFIDPEKVAEIVRVMQNRYCEQDRELALIEEQDGFILPEFNSKPVVFDEDFSMR